MRNIAIFFVGSFLISGCTQQELYTVEKIDYSKKSSNNLCDYYLASQEGKRVILRQKETPSFQLGTRVQFEDSSLSLMKH